MALPPPVLRPATLADAPRVAALAAELGYAAPAEAIRQRLDAILASERDLLWVAELPETGVVGWIHAFLCQLVEAEFRAEIGGLIVDARCHRRGLGRRLVQAVEAWARARGAREISVRCQVKRVEAHRFYADLGFRPVKTQEVFRKTLGLPADPPSNTPSPP